MAGIVVFLNHVTYYSTRSCFPDSNPTNASRDCTPIRQTGERYKDIWVGIVTIAMHDNINVKYVLDDQICLSSIVRFDFGRAVFVCVCGFARI